MKYLMLTLLVTTSALANWNIRKDEVEGVSITDTIAPDPTCKSLGEVYVSIHQPGSNQKNLAKAAKAKGGNFVFIRYKSPYYSYEYGGELYSCLRN
jgi:hypothetical protein